MSSIFMISVNGFQLCVTTNISPLQYQPLNQFRLFLYFYFPQRLQPPSLNKCNLQNTGYKFSFFAVFFITVLPITIFCVFMISVNGYHLCVTTNISPLQYQPLNQFRLFLYFYFPQRLQPPSLNKCNLQNTGYNFSFFAVFFITVLPITVLSFSSTLSSTAP
jgi:hypothetical protein